MTREEDTFLLGHFEGENYSGVYLSPEYIGRLREVAGAARVRLETIGGELPDALKNILGVIERLTKIHAEQTRSEHMPATPGDLAAIEQAMRELEEARRQLEEFSRGPNRPPKK